MAPRHVVIFALSLSSCLEFGELGRTNPYDRYSAYDYDGDGVPNNQDIFPTDPFEWADTDGDGVGDNADNCPEIPNSSQRDLDMDGLGDVCDSDRDGDGVPNEMDLYPDDPAESADSDGDGLPDNQDNCPFVPNPQQEDQDQDGEGDACDDDIDGDGIPNATDCAPTEDNRLPCGLCATGTQVCQGAVLTCDDPLSSEPPPGTACGGICNSATYRCSGAGMACIDPWQSEGVCLFCEASTWSWLTGSNWSQATTFDLHDAGDGTVTDNVTQLTWLACPIAQDAVTCHTPQLLTHQEVLTACSTLTLGGLTWRLPRADEILTVLDFTQGRLAPPFGSYAQTWIQRGSQLAWLTSDGEIIAAPAGATAVARCVSDSNAAGPALLATARAELTSNNVYVDGVTQLQWSAAEAGTAEQAEDQCSALSAAGHEDWRVPQAHELASLSNWCGSLSTGASEALAPSGYFGLPSEPVWSATAVGGEQWVLDAINGMLLRQAPADTASVMCVRP